MKQISDFVVIENRTVAPNFALLKLKLASGEALPEIAPGQFVQIRVDDSPSTFLRRPISICDTDGHTITLLIRKAGEGTAHLIHKPVGSIIDMIYPLGNSFPMPGSVKKPLLIGGGVGTAPMILLGRRLAQNGVEPTFLTGAKTADALLMIDTLREIGTTHITTDDGTMGLKGFVINHPVMQPEALAEFDMVYCCGPAPMMKAVATAAKAAGVPCRVSLENMMACGVGACLCCVENTVKGNVCVCTEGPVFDINQLTW